MTRPVMELILIRHLTTEYNRQGLLQGRLNTDILPPTPEALRIIEDNRLRIQSFGPIDHVLSSGLRRTAATAACYGYATICRPEPLLDELDFGPFEGQSREWMLEQLGDAWFSDPGSLRLGESMAALAGRIGELLEKYRHSRRLLLFGHGAWIRACLSLVENGDLRKMNRIVAEGNSLHRVRLDNSIQLPPWSHEGNGP